MRVNSTMQTWRAVLRDKLFELRCCTEAKAIDWKECEIVEYVEAVIVSRPAIQHPSHLQGVSPR